LLTHSQSNSDFDSYLRAWTDVYLPNLATDREPDIRHATFDCIATILDSLSHKTTPTSTDDDDFVTNSIFRMAKLFFDIMPTVDQRSSPAWIALLFENTTIRDKFISFSHKHDSELASKFVRPQTPLSISLSTCLCYFPLHI